MVCKKCGYALPSEGYICKNCGTMMSEDQIKEQKEYIKENNSQLKPVFLSEQYGKRNIFLARDKNPHKLFGLIFIGVVLIVIFVVAMMVYFN